jgi:hypothetical protein
MLYNLAESTRATLTFWVPTVLAAVLWCQEEEFSAELSLDGDEYKRCAKRTQPHFT